MVVVSFSVTNFSTFSCDPFPLGRLSGATPFFSVTLKKIKKNQNLFRDQKTKQPLLQHIVMDSGQRMYSYDRMQPMIFIGGMPRSGTTLARVLLDAHPDIRCGEETRVLPRLLQMRSQWVKSQKEKMRLEEAGVTMEVADLTFTHSNDVIALILIDCRCSTRQSPLS